MQPQHSKIVRTIAHHVAFWTALCAAGALGVYTDRVQLGREAIYALILREWWVGHIPVMALSSALSLALVRRPALFVERRTTLRVYAGIVLLFLPLEWWFLACADVLLRGEVLTLASGWREFTQMGKMTWFGETAWTTGTFIAMVAIGNHREARARSEAFAKAQAENLNLHLALEQQRMLALRAQLEPHFIFNALNAISALVRAGDKADALAGIGRLSDLLRYALSATQREQATIDEELGFIRDYLALQRLRYGERLRIRIDGDDERVRRGECPPLLLQPLIENALRHDLDCHDGAGDIRLSFERSADELLIRVMNPVSAYSSPNPGTGLGLANTRARLALANPRATLRTEQQGSHFLAEISLPLALRD
ncbi:MULTISPECIES: sensor histidine kinase [unclassified Massilia]|uniref:sensor histidine kinase n=1 Tax=unclassified Massilia TaxID=2609279 RepID=UPI00177E5AB7|nr:MULTISPECIES: histidine kinase [unclassified Massilia]MBD8532427.1 histidine kinase [Massilia sp. CFBP 13647]MBD8675747.1 histidine kinase [Massilia sp. CFBP 13721]